MSGATIGDIGKIAGDFYHENRDSVYKVDKIILNVGTNEMKWFNSTKYNVFKRYRAPLVNLVKNLKYLFPYAQLIFQSLVSTAYSYILQLYC